MLSQGGHQTPCAAPTHGHGTAAAARGSLRPLGKARDSFAHRADQRAGEHVPGETGWQARQTPKEEKTDNDRIHSPTHFHSMDIRHAAASKESLEQHPHAPQLPAQPPGDTAQGLNPPHRLKGAAPCWPSHQMI